MNMHELTAFAHHLADMSGQVIRHYFRQHPEVELKGDNSPVTIADREAERVLRQHINQFYPDHGIIGEEFGTEREDARYVWVLDPVDGTVSFTIGRPIFGTLISLVDNGTPILGIIDQPIGKDRWIGGKDTPTLLNHMPVRTRTDVTLKNAIIATTGPNYFKNNEWEAFQRVAVQAQRPVYGGDCYNYGLLAMGAVDIVMESGLKCHDFCALAPVVAAAGGVMTDWQGNALTLKSDGKVIAAANERLLKEALTLL